MSITATAAITDYELDALSDFMSLAYDCFGPGADDVIEEFGEDRYESIYVFINRAAAAFNGR
jgi:hypothetical protein